MLSTAEWQHVSRLNFAATTDSAGTLWVLVGIDSGFEGSTVLYYNTIDVQLTRIDE